MQHRHKHSDVIVWGSYDESKPRVRLLLAALEKRGALRSRINIPIWQDVRDKAVASRAEVLKRVLRLLGKYPAALVKLLRQPSQRAVFLLYPAIPDIFMVWPVARLRRHQIVLDAFIPLHDTLVRDRGLLAMKSAAAKLAFWAERFALKLADIIVVDTDQHGDFLAEEYAIPRDRFQTVLVGAETLFWNARHIAKRRCAEPPRTVLFYGQLVPLHGIETILDAIRRTADEPIRWLLIGSGQEEPKLHRFLEQYRSGNVTWLPWIVYEDLPKTIAAADAALGIFGTSGKAARVIPNKAFQVLAVGTPLITRQSPAIEPLARRYPDAIRTVPAGDGAALADIVRETVGRPLRWCPVPGGAAQELDAEPGVTELLRRLSRTLDQTGVIAR